MAQIKFSAKSRQRIIVEIGASALKWIFVKGAAGSPELVEMGVIPTARPTTQEELSAVIKKYKIQTDEVSSVLPRYQVTARNLELPSTQPAEIKKIIDLQAVKQTPYAANEIVFDYHLLKSLREGYSSVMLVVAHRQVLNAHLKLLNESNLKPQQITLGTEGSALWAARQLKNQKPEEVTAVLDVDAQASDFFILHGRELLFTQNLSVGAEKLETEAGPGAEKLADEISRSLHIYRSEEIAKEPAVLLVTGAYSALKPGFEKLAAASGIAAVQELALPDAAAKLLKDPDKSAWGNRYSFSSILGLAHQEKPLPINLVPEETLLKESILEKGRSLLVTGVLALSIFLVVSGIFGAMYYRKIQYLKWLDTKYAATQDTAGQVRAMKKRVKDVLEMHDTSLRIFDEIIHVHRVIPKEIYLTEVNISKDDRFQMQGRAESMTSVFDFVNSVKSSALFKDVETKRINKRIVDNKEVVDFEIDSRLVAQPTPATAKLQGQLKE